MRQPQTMAEIVYPLPGSVGVAASTLERSPSLLAGLTLVLSACDTLTASGPELLLPRATASDLWRHLQGSWRTWLFSPAELRNVLVTSPLSG